MTSQSIERLRKLENLEQKLALLRREYPSAVISRQKTIHMMARSLQIAYEKITGKPYQRPLENSLIQKGIV